MTTARGPEYLPPQKPEPDQTPNPFAPITEIAAIAARVMRRVPPRRASHLADSITATRVPGPDDTTLMAVTPPRPETLADVEQAQAAAVDRALPPNTQSTVRLDAWRIYIDQAETDLDVLHPDHDDLAMHAAVAALTLATTALRHASQLAAPYLDDTNTMRPAPTPALGRLIAGLGDVHAEIGAVVDRTVRQLGTLHQHAVRGEVTAPPGADPFAEIEAVMRDLLAIANNTTESTSRADVAGRRLTRIDWPSAKWPSDIIIPT